MVCTLLLSGAAYAQNMTVKGKVTANGEELPGVTVTVKGSGGGTITSLDGDYSIKADAGSILVFSFIGYETVEIPVKHRQLASGQRVEGLARQRRRLAVILAQRPAG